MGEQTAISWCDHTFNPWIGCTKVSVGPQGACEGCYAEALAKRYGWAKWGDHPRQRTSAANWREPLAWDRKAADAGTRPFVFCASLADVFDNQVDPAWRRELFDLIRATPNLIWLLLTKRPQNIAKLFAETITPELRAAHQGPGHLGRSLWPSNAAIGCTIVTQAEADRDIPILLAAKAALNPAFAFVSMEPLMGAVDLRPWIDPRWTGCCQCYVGPLDSEVEYDRNGVARCPRCNYALGGDLKPSIDWVIAGGETDQGGHKARPSHPDWFRSLRDQCAAAGVAFHFKQWGENAPANAVADPSFTARGFTQWLPGSPQGSEAIVCRVGKKTAGRALDGVIHDARPTPQDPT